MKWDKFFRFGLAILFLWTSLALAAPAARAGFGYDAARERPLGAVFTAEPH